MVKTGRLASKAIPSPILAANYIDDAAKVAKPVIITTQGVSNGVTGQNLNGTGTNNIATTQNVAAEAKAAAPVKESGVSKALETAGTVFNVGSAAVGLSPLGAPLIAGGAKGTSKLFGWMKLDWLSKKFAGASKAITDFSGESFAKITGKLPGASKVAKASQWTADKVAPTAAKLGLKGVEELPRALGKGNVLESAANVSFIVGSGVEMGSAVHGLTSGWDKLRRMEAEIKGVPENQISKTSLMYGNVSPLTKAARSKLLKSFVVSEASGIAQMVLSVRGALANKVPWLAWPAVMLAGTGAESLIGDKFLDTFTEMSSLYKSGNRLPADAYAKLLGAASPELAKRGGEEGAFTQRIAEDMAAENLDPVKAMREVMNGGVVKRVAAITAANEAAKAAAPAPVQPEHSHVAALQKGVVATKQQAVVGAHSAAVAAQAAQTGEVKRT